MSENKFKPARNYSDNAKLAIQGQPWDETVKWKRPTMKLRVVNGNLRITAYLNHPDDSKPGYVTANMDPVIGNIFINLVEAAATDESFTVKGIRNRTRERDRGGEATGKVVENSKVYVARDGEGVVTIIVESVDYSDRLVFQLLPDFYYNLIDKHGKPLEPAVASNLVAMGWVKVMREVLGPMLITTGEEADAKRQKAKDNKGGGNSWGNKSNDNKGKWNGGGQSSGGSKSGGVTDIFNDVA